MTTHSTLQNLRSDSIRIRELIPQTPRFATEHSDVLIIRAYDEGNLIPNTSHFLKFFTYFHNILLKIFLIDCNYFNLILRCWKKAHSIFLQESLVKWTPLKLHILLSILNFTDDVYFLCVSPKYLFVSLHNKILVSDLGGIPKLCQ